MKTRYAIRLDRTAADEACTKCGGKTANMFSVTLSNGRKSQTAVFCAACARELKKQVEEKNRALEQRPGAGPEKAPVGRSAAEKRFDLDDPSTYPLLNREQRRIAEQYQSAVHSPLWAEGCSAKKLKRAARTSDDDFRAKVLKRFCDAAGYFFANGPASFSLPLDVFGYIKGKNVEKTDSLYTSLYAVFTRYDSCDFGELIEKAGKALADWNDQTVLTKTMAAAAVYLRTTDKKQLDRAVLMLIEAAKLHHDKPDRELYDSAWALWAATAAALDFDDRYRRIVQAIIAGSGGKAPA